MKLFERLPEPVLDLTLGEEEKVWNLACLRVRVGCEQVRYDEQGPEDSTPGDTGRDWRGVDLNDLSWLQPARSCGMWGSSAEENLLRRVACGVPPAGVIRGHVHFFMNGETGIFA